MLKHFLTIHTLQNHPSGEAVGRILEAALDAVRPSSLLSGQVLVRGCELRVANKTFQLHAHHRNILIAIGKAGLSMVNAWLSLPDMPEPDKGIVVVKHAMGHTTLGTLAIVEGGHPIPDERSLLAGQKIRALLTSLGAEDLVVCLISGGGSALVTLPPSGVRLRDMQVLTDALLRCGAAIAEVNIVRRHLDRLKGGGLARQAFPAQVLTLMLSDVPSDSLEAIASGPTVPDPTTVQDALAVLDKYHLLSRMPRTLLNAFLETPKPGDIIFANVQNVVIGSNKDAMRAALKQAQVEGFHSFLLCDHIHGEAREAARTLCRVLRQVHDTGQPAPRPACLIAGGETTVTLGDSRGRGGRNQELALAAVNELAGLSNVLLVALATDGEDGPTDAAGAVVSGETARRARDLGLDPHNALQQHDSYSFFSALGDAIKIGPTGTNVNDLILLFAF